MKMVGVYVYLKVPDSMPQSQVVQDLRTCISFGSPEIFVQFVLPEAENPA